MMPIYLDYAATSPMDPRVAQAMADCLADRASAGNPANADHVYGRRAKLRIEAARAQVATLIGAPAEAIVFTSGATESVNLAVLGAVRAAGTGRRHVVSSRTEHRAGLGACGQLEREGVAVTYLASDPLGLIEPEAVLEALTAETVLVSLMLVNNETGVLQEFGSLGRALGARGVLLHIDAAQAAGRVAIDVTALQADLLSLSAHKIGGPAGIGALYVRRRPRPALEPLLFGGGQEGTLRSGTLATHQIVGMGEAYALAGRLFAAETERLAMLRGRLWRALEALGGVYRNGHPQRCAPHILNVSIEGVDGEALIAGLEELALSSGAACSSGLDQASYVLKALGRDERLARASLRISLGRETTAAEVERAGREIAEEVKRLRTLAPEAAGG